MADLVVLLRPAGGVTEHAPTICHGQVLLRLLSWRRKKILEKSERRTGLDTARR